MFNGDGEDIIGMILTEYIERVMSQADYDKEEVSC